MGVQLVVGSEALALCTAADAAGDEQLLRRHVPPDALQCLLIGAVARQRRHVGHTTVEIAGTDGVTYDLVLLEDGHVVLRVHARCMTVGAAARLVDEVLGTLQILPVARHLVELAERHLDDGVSAGAVYLSLAGAEGTADEVGIADGHVQERTLARGAVVGHGTLYQVSAVVELVGVNLLPAVSAPPAAQARTLISDAGRQVAVGLLRQGDDADDGVEIVVQLFVVLGSQGIGSPLDDLIGVGIVEREVAAVLLHVIVGVAQIGGRQGEVVETSVLLALAEGRGDADGAVHLDAGCPEGIVEVDLREGHLLNGS